MRAAMTSNTHFTYTTPNMHPACMNTSNTQPTIDPVIQAPPDSRSTYGRTNITQSPSQPPTSLGPNGRPLIQGIELVSIHQLPDRFKTIFPHPLFNAVQSKCFEAAYATDDNIVLSAPTGSGKTGVLELAICRLVLTKPQQSFKVIYQAPTKSLCTERHRDWQVKFQSLGLTCAELTGDTEQSQLRLVGSADILITTPEKWDSITRKWRDHYRLVDLVKLFLIDEVQILKEDRGASLEAVVSRMKSGGNLDVRFIALSATVPNAADVAKWLGKNATMKHMPARVEVFDESFRPVKLDKHVHGLSANGLNDFAFEKACSNKLVEIIAKYCTCMKPLMIFCFTRKSTEVTAQLLADWWQRSPPSRKFWAAPDGSVSVGITDRNLQHCMSSGVAYHHAGVDLANRARIESAYLEGRINVICCTSTLAGIDGCREYSDLEIMQMLGRAGRPQFGRTAIAVIITRQEKVQRYERMVTGQEVIESRLHLNLIDHLNAEIGLGTIFNALSAKVWLRSTFFYIRYSQNPSHYKLQDPQGEAGTSDSIDDLITQVSGRDINLLREHSLVTSVSDADSFKSTEYGEAMARYYIQFETMKVLLSLPVKPKLSDIITAISQASEFKSIRFRAGEKPIFKEINASGSIKCPIKVDLALPTHKVSLIIQATLGGIDLSKEDSFTVRCVVDCQLHDEDAVGAKNALELARSIGARAWDDSPLQMIQIEKIGPVAVRKMVSAGVRTIEELEELDSQRIDMILSKNPPFGASILAALKPFPKLRVALRTIGQPSIRTVDGMKVIRVNIKAELGFLNDSPPTFFSKKAVHVCLLAETSDRRKIYFCRISAPKLGRGQDIAFSADIVNPDQTVICYVSCDDIAGTLKYATLDLQVPLSLFSRIGGLEIEPAPLPKAKRLGIRNEQPERPIPKLNDRNTNISIDDLNDSDLEAAASLAEAVAEFETSEGGVKAGFIDIDSLNGNTNTSRRVEYNGILAGKGRSRSSLTSNLDERQQLTTFQNTQPVQNQEQLWTPQKLPNGNWKCNHKCKDKNTCKHRCCQEGVDKPPSRPKSLKTSKSAEECDVQNPNTGRASKVSEACESAKKTISAHWGIPKLKSTQQDYTTTTRNSHSNVTLGANVDQNRSSSLDNLTDLTERSDPTQGQSAESCKKVARLSIGTGNSGTLAPEYGENRLNPFKFKVPELDLSGTDSLQFKAPIGAAASATVIRGTTCERPQNATQEFRAAIADFMHVEPSENAGRVETPLMEVAASSNSDEDIAGRSFSGNEGLHGTADEKERPRKRVCIELRDTPEIGTRPAFERVPGLNEGTKIPKSSSADVENSILNEIANLNKSLRSANGTKEFQTSTLRGEYSWDPTHGSSSIETQGSKLPNLSKKYSVNSMGLSSADSANVAKREVPVPKRTAFATVSDAFKALDSLVKRADDFAKMRVELDAWLEREAGGYTEFF